MAFRLIVTEKGDLTTVRVAGRLADDALIPLTEACRARRPLVVDLSQVTGASNAAVLLLRRLTREGVHLLGASQYVTLLLAAEAPPPKSDRSRLRRRRPRRAPGPAQRNPQRSR